MIGSWRGIVGRLSHSRRWSETRVKSRSSTSPHQPEIIEIIQGAGSGAVERARNDADFYGPFMTLSTFKLESRSLARSFGRRNLRVAAATAATTATAAHNSRRSAANAKRSKADLTNFGSFRSRPT